MHDTPRRFSVFSGKVAGQNGELLQASRQITQKLAAALSNREADVLAVLFVWAAREIIFALQNPVPLPLSPKGTCGSTGDPVELRDPSNAAVQRQSNNRRRLTCVRLRRKLHLGARLNGLAGNLSHRNSLETC